MKSYDYLYEKISKIHPDSGRIYNRGALLIAQLPDWPALLEHFTTTAWETLLRYVVYNKQSRYISQVKLTFTSERIGRRVAQESGGEIDPTNIYATLGLGDLFLEAFLQEDLIEIFREYDGWRAPFVIQLKGDLNAIRPVLVGTTFDPMEEVKTLNSPLTKEPYIKGWTDDQLFRSYLHRPFIKTLNKLRAQAWVINLPVLKALKKNPPPSAIDLVNPEGVVYSFNLQGEIPKGDLKHTDGAPFLGSQDSRLQKMRSKYFEYRQVISKADLISKFNKPFYQEISFDYRGRIYYTENFLNYQGNDIARSLFLFHEKKLVDENGFKWLLIHAANSYNQNYSFKELEELPWNTHSDYIKHLQNEKLDSISVDKMSLKDREEWSRQNLEMLLKAAIRNTVHKEAENPYAFFAVCQEIKLFLEARSEGKPYCSGLPIPLDGAQNGWAHLAALSKDKQAGALVSLTPAEIQNDFYVAVAKSLVSFMPEWFKSRNIPMKHIRKGIAKRGAMTRAYSAGKKRISKNMYDDCHVEGYTSMYNITQEDCKELAGNLIKAINRVCAGPLKTTKYLQKLAAHEILNDRRSIEWVTPSGFPVVYKAYLQRQCKLRGTINGIKGGAPGGRIRHVIKVDVLDSNKKKVPCKRSFASGISPNFVHSMDAAHLSLVVNAFHGCFAAVHDSFATHASDVEELHKVIREEFIRIYNVDKPFHLIVDKMMLHKDTFQEDHPPLGKLNIEDVRDSEYFFC